MHMSEVSLSQFLFLPCRFLSLSSVGYKSKRVQDSESSEFSWIPRRLVEQVEIVEHFLFEYCMGTHISIDTCHSFRSSVLGSFFRVGSVAESKPDHRFNFLRCSSFFLDQESSWVVFFGNLKPPTVHPSVQCLMLRHLICALLRERVDLFRVDSCKSVKCTVNQRCWLKSWWDSTADEQTEISERRKRKERLNWIRE